MNSEDLDKILQRKLGAMQPRPADDAWDILARRMDREADSLASHSPIDEPLRQSLNAMRPQYSSSHWQQLAQRLRTESQLRKKLFISKSIELSLICLLLFTMGRTIDLRPGDRTPELHKDQAPGVPATPIAAQDKTTISQGALTSLNPHTRNKTESHSAAPSNRPGLLAASAATDRSRPRPAGVVRVSADAAIAPGSAQASAKGRGLNTTIASSSSSSSSSGKNNALVPGASTLATSSPGGLQPLAALSSGGGAEQAESAAGAPLEGIGLLPMAETSIQYTRQEEEIASRIRKAKLSRIWTPTLGLVCGFSNNKIQSPSGGLYSLEFSSQNWISPEIGFTFLLDNQLFGIETGLYYSYIQYKGILPRYNSVHFMKVPLNLRIIPLQQEEWNLYFLAGATLHLAASARYDRPGTQDLGGTVSNPEGYEKGLFEGGEYKSNTYYTYNVGVGFERYYSNNMRVFGQIMRSRSLFDDRFSPSLNKIKATAFQIGMRIPIN